MNEKTYLVGMAATLVGIGVVAWKMRPAPAVASASILAPPSALATWPLPNGTQLKGVRGVSHFSSRDKDGTDVDVLEFDFKANPKLDLELFDQDSDDKKPFDNQARFWGRNAAYVLTHQKSEKGELVAAWNGGPFTFNRQKSEDKGFHVAPLVENGRVHFSGVNSEESELWTFGVRSTQPKFDVLLRPSERELRGFSFATGGVQCLVRAGKPLVLGELAVKGKWSSFKSPGSNDAGSRGRADWLKTSRVSLGWNRDGSKLWVLGVHEAQAEVESRVQLSARLRGEFDPQTFPVVGGWSLEDVQGFWRARGAWGAVALSSGDFSQLAFRRVDGRVEFVPSHVALCAWKDANCRTRLVCKSDLKGAPTGGSALFYWTVREKRENGQ